MPYEWTPPLDTTGPGYDGPRRLSLWPYRSLLRRDFVVFMAATLTLVALPLLATLGTPVMWAMLIPLALMVAALWKAIDISYRRGEVLEEFTLDATTAQLVRHMPGKGPQSWDANRHWVSVHLYPNEGPVENYITLRGSNREVEIGAFLDVSERLVLYSELRHLFKDQ